MGRSKYPGRRRGNLSSCLNSYRLEPGEMEILLPEGNQHDLYFRLGKMRFIVYDERVLEDNTLDGDKKEALRKVPKNASKAMVTTQSGRDGIFYKIVLDGQEFAFEENAKEPDACLGSNPLYDGVKTFKRPEGSHYYLAEGSKIKFYPEGAREDRRIGDKKKRKLKEIPKRASEVRIAVYAHEYKNYYQYNWR